MDRLFDIANGMALMGWGLLVAWLLRPGLGAVAVPIARTGAPALFAAAYVVLLAQGWGDARGGGFSSLAGVRALFSVDAALVAGWIHYLAFDLLVGSLIVEGGLARGIPRLLLIPCLLLTFLFGPAGWLLFLLVRAIAARKD